MPRYLVESLVPSSPDGFDDICRRARSLSAHDAGIQYVRTTFLPGDETAMHVFDASSLQALADAGRVAGLRFERIVQWSNDPVSDR